MKRPKIVIDSDIPFIRGRLEPWADTVYTDQFGFTPQIVADADAMIIRTRTRCDSHLLEGSQVRMIATATIGMDQFDLPWCRDNGITTVNAPGCNAPAVAQYVWASLLHHGFDPQGKTVGVVGCGNVGSIVADWGRRLGARVLVSDPPKAEKGELDVDDTPLDDLLAQSDMVTLHVPVTRTGKHRTHHLIGECQLSLMRPGTWLVNAARGPVVDNEAWADAITHAGIKAIVDVWEDEPGVNQRLLSLADEATFHIAGYSLEGKQRATRMAIEAVSRHFGRPVDLSGLAGDYRCPQPLSPCEIARSFDPAPITAALRANPDQFDILRKNYIFRPEVGNTSDKDVSITLTV